MEPSISLIVAMMYMTLLSIGLGNLIMNLAASVQGRRSHAMGVVLAWELLLLLLTFVFLWHTLELLKIEDWTFFSFVYIEAGPILMVLACQIIGTEPSDPESKPVYMEIASRFFLVVALLQVWLVGTDVFLGDPSIATWFNVAFTVVALALTRSESALHHRLGAVAGYVLLAAGVVLRELGLA